MSTDSSRSDAVNVTQIVPYKETDSITLNIREKKKITIIKRKRIAYNLK